MEEEDDIVICEQYSIMNTRINVKLGMILDALLKMKLMVKSNFLLQKIFWLMH